MSSPPTLALSMIVKNASRDLAECLASARQAVHEIVIADTGSSDQTVEIARQAGARVFSTTWDNDFSKARNFCLQHVAADWVLMLDADERLDTSAPSVLAAILAVKKFDGFQVTIRNYVPTLETTLWDRAARPNHSSFPPVRDFPACVDHENVRLFRRHPDIYFTGRVHETVGWRLLETGRAIGSCDLVIHHLGMTRDPEERARKILFYRELGKQKVAEMPLNSQAHFELGLSELENFGNPLEALKSLERACQLDPRFGVAWFFVGVCHLRAGQPRSALPSFQRAESCGHTTHLVAELAGDAHYNLADFNSAVACYRRGLKRAHASPPIESKLGLAEIRNGQVAAGLKKIHAAIQMQPWNPDLHDRLIRAEVWLGNLAAATDAAEAKLLAVAPRPEDFLRAASICAQTQDWLRASAILNRGLAIFPDSDQLQIKLRQIETSPPSSSPSFPQQTHH